MTSLGSVNDNRLHTTLLSSSSPLFVDLRDALVISMVQGGKRIPVKPGNPQKTSLGISPWEKHPHQAFGVQLENDAKPLQRTPVPDIEDTKLIDSLATSVGQWIQQDSSEFEDAFQPVSKVNSKEQPINVPSKSPKLTSETARPATRRARTVRGAPKASHSMIPAALDTDASASEPLTAPQVTNRPLPENKLSAGNQNLSEHDKIQQSFKNAGAPKIEPPYMPPSASSIDLSTPPQSMSERLKSSFAIDSRSSIEWEGNVVRGSKGSRLIDMEDAHDDVGTNTRKDFKYTMNQKKPQQRVTRSKTETIKNFEKVARQILNLALPRQGPLNLEVGIGRLLISPQPYISEFKKPFTMAEWDSAFPIRVGIGGGSRKTLFTPRLTTRSLDVESLLDLKLPQGRKLFQAEPCERRVSYAIFCMTKRNEQVIIEVCEDKSFQIKGLEVLAGTLEWHYPLRSWDARLQLVVREHQFNNYQQQAQVIVDNMGTRNSVDMKTIEFFTTAIDQELKVQSVQLRRETAHSVTAYPDLLLHLKEIQEISIQRKPGPKDYYFGTIDIPAKMISAGKLWWEVTITSITATQIFRGNDVLEFGEVAKWSPKTLVSAGVIRDMHCLATEIVTRIDHIGFHNRGPKSNSDPKTGSMTKTDSSLQGPSEMARYW